MSYSSSTEGSVVGRACGHWHSILRQGRVGEVAFGVGVPGFGFVLEQP